VNHLADSWQTIAAAIEALVPRVIADEGLEREADHVNNPECEDYFHKPVEYARDTCVWYMCEKCGSPYYGGRADCGGADEAANYACATCSRLLLNVMCERHGDDHMVYKCVWCCKPALFFCWGTTHFCEECHTRPLEVVKGPWPACDGKCMFHPHEPNGTRKVVGYCRTCEAERAMRRRT
jgi:E3 ubiquitin-protein ligase MYCBP2